MTTRFDFYQSDTDLIVSIYKKGVPADQVRIVAHDDEVEVFVGEESILRLGPLSGLIVANGVTHKVYDTKIELKLPKATGGHWPNLIRTESDDAPRPTIQQPIQPTQKESPTAAVAPKKKNWDNLAKEIEQIDDQEPASPLHLLYQSTSLTPSPPQAGTPDAFFKTLYGDLDEDSRRAMLKSYQESNGTVLSTNWREVGTKYQAPQPPAGMEVRKD